MAVKIYSYKNCSTCRKALGFLSQREVSFQSIDIASSPPGKPELKAMLAHYGGKIRKLFNTSGQAYRELGLSGKIDDMSPEEALTLLASNGKLVKRPFLMRDGQPIAIGFDEKEWEGALVTAGL